MPQSAKHPSTREITVPLAAFEAILANSIRATLALQEVEGNTERVNKFLGQNSGAMRMVEGLKALSR